MKTKKNVRAIVRPMIIAAALGGLTLSAAPTAQAQGPLPRHRIAAHGRAAGPVAGRVLTVHRRFARLPRPHRFVDGYGGPALLRDWNDPNLDSFGGWRLGGDNFYGDGRGDPITRGNSALGAIAGYGPARGGYGGPHFDSVGGFHDGPGPDAEEDADYASGSISTPDYGDIVPRYASVKARVASLTTGIGPAANSRRFSRSSLRGPVPPSADISPLPRSEDLFPDLGIDAF